MIGRFLRSLGGRTSAPPRLVWRMSRAHPIGIYVDAGAPMSMAALPARESDRSWQTSSFELLDGLQVSESPLDGLDDGQVDELVMPAVDRQGAT